MDRPKVVRLSAVQIAELALFKRKIDDLKYEELRINTAWANMCLNAREYQLNIKDSLQHQYPFIHNNWTLSDDGIYMVGS